MMSVILRVIGVKVPNNLFRRALEIHSRKLGSQLTEEEEKLLSAAMIPLNILPQYQDIPIDLGLQELAEIVEEAHERIS